MGRRLDRAVERPWVVLPTRSLEPDVALVALVMVKAQAAARGKVLVRKVEAMVEAMKLRMVVAVSS